MVLGAGLRGNSISASLLYRLETALNFHEMYPDVKIVVSGGKGEGENMAEALAMRKFLVDNGVSPSLIIMEDKSTDTYENFLEDNLHWNALGKKIVGCIIGEYMKDYKITELIN